mmetsp:Transcript_11826/g.33959  ORF Transcript_11826/g.33959 Transcript_11826/m.33959 type:complete len:112 (-) Transcript_11826:94-429(-)
MMILSPTNQPPTRAILITVIVVRNTTGRRSIVLGSCVRAYIPKLSVPFEHVATGKEASIGTAGCATYAMLCYALPMLVPMSANGGAASVRWRQNPRRNGSHSHNAPGARHW